MKKLLISMMFLLIIAFTILGNTLIFAHEAYLNISYDKCSPECMLNNIPVENNDGEDEM